MSVELEVQRIQQLVQERRFAEGLTAADALLVSVPENRDVLYMRALAQRMLGEVPAALATLERLQELHPRFSRVHQERGQCYVALKQAPRAIEAFMHAVHMNPALPVSWSMLEGLFRMTRQAQSAADAAAHVATLKKLPPEVVTANALFCDGDVAEAERRIREFLVAHGHHVEAMRLLARIGLEQDVLDDAQLLLEGVLDVAPDYHAARFDYAQVLIKRHMHQSAREQAERLLAIDPANRNYRTLYALTYVGVGQHERAIEIYRDLLTGATQPADLHMSIAHSLKTLGRREEAIAAYRAAVVARPGYGDVYWSLANLKTYRFDDAELAAMRAAESAPSTTTVDRYHLCFALGKALEDRQEYAESFACYARGNSLKRAESRYKPEVMELNTRLQMEICNRQLFARHGTGAREAATADAPNRIPAADGSHAAEAVPIFIVGLPRSGSTLIEQILASHSAVEGTQELADIPRLVVDLRGRESELDNPRYPAVLADMSTAEFQRLGQKYLADTRVYRTGKPLFIDKMPNNFRHIGLIHLMLPNARIIDARREPMACCFGNFKQLFAHGQEFTYSLEDIARYYRTYLDLMRHWDDVLPGRVLRVQHEDVVEDLEGSVRRLLDYCGLEFEPACVEFYKTERSVRTASSEQVRQPIYREGLDQWRHYEPWLGSLRKALGDAVKGYAASSSRGP